ncbi:hypothetical protein N9H34_00815 [bacterium]|nr:hypothetical protein [bacterium]|tara:strand:- start:105 stop:503 length:399 start_codon:yes stop_codon:yes gene_type:complete
MKDNFDLYNWKQGKNPTDDSKGEFNLYEWNKKRYLGELEIDQEDNNINQDDESGSINIDRGGDDARMGAEEESDSNVVGEAEEKEYEVEYWILTNDGYDNEYIKVKAKSEEDAIMKAKEETRRGKDFKIYKR